mmetsp:Transcript_29245/g.62838  ORF Transcript_29245/g.62838 Transcript_29245/m.62838 type:complete len:369 (-) Transcript_29245:961-2067(-)
MISSPRESSSTTPPPRASDAQSTPSSSGGSACIGLVPTLPVATPPPKVPSVSASKAPMARAQRSLEGESTTMVGRSISESSKCAAKPGWHVASSHEMESGPPARFCLSLVSICRCASLLGLSAAPSSSAIAHSPPLLVHSVSKLWAESSGRGPRSLEGIGLAFSCVRCRGSPSGPAASYSAPSCALRCSRKPATKFARLPKENLPCICGTNCMPCSCISWAPSSAGAANMTITVGLFFTLKRAIIEGGIIANASSPSNSIERERNMGGMSGLSEKSKHMDLALEPESACGIHGSAVSGPSLSTRLMGSESRAAFLAAASPVSSAPNLVPCFGVLAPVPKGRTTTAGNFLTPNLAARAASLTEAMLTCP